MNTLKFYRALVALYMKNGKDTYNLPEWFGTDQETLDLFLEDQTKVIFTVYHNPDDRSPSGWNMVKVDDDIKGGSFEFVIIDELIKDSKE